MKTAEIKQQVLSKLQNIFIGGINSAAISQTLNLFDEYDENIIIESLYKLDKKLSLTKSLVDMASTHFKPSLSIVLDKGDYGKVTMRLIAILNKGKKGKEKRILAIGDNYLLRHAITEGKKYEEYVKSHPKEAIYVIGLYRTLVLSVTNFISYGTPHGDLDRSLLELASGNLKTDYKQRSYRYYFQKFIEPAHEKEVREILGIKA